MVTEALCSYEDKALSRNWIAVMIRFYLAAACALALLSQTEMVSAATVQNGSFEDIGTGTLNNRGWRHFSSIPGWDGLPNVEIQSDPTLRHINAQHGDNYAELDTNTNAGMLQEINFSAGTYELSFFYSPRVNQSQTTTNDMYYKVFAGPAHSPNTELLYGEINDAPNIETPYGRWTEVTGIFDVTVAGTYSLLFQASGEQRTSGCGDCGALIDNASISAVPLPAPALLLLTSLACMYSVRLRRKHLKAK